MKTSEKKSTLFNHTKGLFVGPDRVKPTMAWVAPYKLAYEPVKYLLFDNPLTRTLDVMWENASTAEVSKVSGQDIQNKATEAVDLQYLTSITDGAKNKVLGVADWNDRSVMDLEKKKQPVT